VSDEQDRAESLDDDELGDADYPPDRLEGANQYGTTGAEERFGEPLEEQVRRDEPDEEDADVDAVGHLVDPDEGGFDDTDADLVATEVEDDDDTGRGTASELSAEEAAVHTTRDRDR
jgi:hypothetical protein